MNLKLNEIYYSIQGETSFTGLPCVFVRTTGCSLRCRWCDTEYAFHEGTLWSFQSILNEIKQYQCSLIKVTGGEPLDQKNIHPLLTQLCDLKYTVLLETGGHRPIENIDPRVRIILDLKCPSSEMSKRNRMTNLNYITQKDEAKFVIGTREDYEWAKSIINDYDFHGAHVLFSPVYNEIEPRLLAEWIKEDRLSVRFQIQLHKAIWGGDTHGV